MLDKLNQIDRARNNRRKSAKSPINIRNKIRELQIQMEKHQKVKDVYRRSPHVQRLQLLETHPTASPIHNSNREAQRVRNKVIFKSEEKRQAVKTKNDRPPLIDHQLTKRQDMNLKKAAEPTRRLFSPQILTRRQSDNQTSKGVQQKQQGQQQKIYQTLLKENQRYKQIYNQSVEKLHQLEERLHSIKQEHQNQKNQLESVIQQLKCKIDQKKTNHLAHIYSFDVRTNNFLVVKDKIITETDNENSSSHVETRKAGYASPVVSFLSAQSK